MESNNKGYKQLIVYQRAKDLALLVYKFTKLFPKEELYGLTSQIRRAALSVAANIVEGYGKHTRKERAQFAYNAIGSLTETEFFIDFSYELDYINMDQYKQMIQLRDEVGKLLNGYIKSLLLVTKP